jgi:hypothetical protein
MIDDKYADGSRTRYTRSENTAFKRNCHMNPNGASNEITARHITAPLPRLPPIKASRRELMTFRLELRAQQPHRGLALRVYKRYQSIGSDFETPSLTNGKEPARQQKWHNSADCRLPFADYSHGDDDVNVQAVEDQGGIPEAAGNEHDKGGEDTQLTSEDDDFEV